MIRISSAVLALLCVYCRLVYTGTLTVEQLIFATSCHVNYSFSCTTSEVVDGDCKNETTLPTLPPIDQSTVDDGFIKPATELGGPSGPLIDPPDSSRCFNNTSGQRCCMGSACDPNPCLNGGTCEKDNDKEVCKCEGPYNGTRCENKICPDNCNDGADCIQGECKCREGYEKSGSYCTAYCPGKDIYTRDCPEVSYSFAKTYESLQAESTSHCDDGRVKAAIRCVTGTDGSPSFDEKTLICASCNLTIDTDVEVPATTEAVAKEVSNLQLLTSTNATLKKEDARKSIKVLDSIRDATRNDTVEVSTDTMTAVLNIAESVAESLVAEENTTESATDKKEIAEYKKEVVKLIDDFARAVTLPVNETEVVIFTEKMVLKVVESTPKPDGSFQTVVYDTPGYVIPSDTDVSTPPTTTTVATTIAGAATPTTSSTPTTTTTAAKAQTAAPVKMKTVRMEIPPDVLKQMNEFATSASGTTSMRLVFVLHQDSSLLTVDNNTGQVIQASYSGNQTGADPKTLTKAFTIEHYAPTPKPEEKQVKGTRKRIKAEYECVFWDYKAQDWSRIGCRYKKQNGKHLCECDHFTSFALLMQIWEINDPPKPDYFSLIACSLSVICLIVTIIIYLAVRDLRVRRPTPIMVNLCLCLMFGYLFYLIGVDKVDSLNFCYASTLLMHTALLCSWFWMLVYSLNIYHALVTVVGAKSFVAGKLFMYLFGYGVPVLIICINFVSTMVLDQQEMDRENYYRSDLGFDSKYKSKYMCWIQSFSLYLAFLTPVAIILVINIVIFAVIIRKLTRKRQQIRSTKESANIKQQILMAVTVMAMMGLTWTFGFTMLVSEDPGYFLAMSIIFNIFNTTQGVVIFLLNCVRQEQVRKMWLTPMLKFFGCDKCISPKPDTSRPSDTRSLTNAGTSTNATGASTLPRESNASTAL